MRAHCAHGKATRTKVQHVQRNLKLYDLRFCTSETNLSLLFRNAFYHVFLIFQMMFEYVSLYVQGRTKLFRKGQDRKLFLLAVKNGWANVFLQ